MGHLALIGLVGSAGGRSARDALLKPTQGRSRRFITTDVTPITMLLLFVYVFGGAIDAGNGSCRLCAHDETPTGASSPLRGQPPLRYLFLLLPFEATGSEGTAVSEGCVVGVGTEVAGLSSTSVTRIVYPNPGPDRVRK